ncbi:MAG: M28 family metallopeptidase [Eubacteriales bacterium]
MKRGLWRFIRYFCMVFLILSIGTALGYFQISPDKAPGTGKETSITLKDVKTGIPDFNMTMSHLKEMSREAHPSKSKENDLVKSYLTSQFNVMGLDYVENASSLTMTTNYLVKIDAPDTDKGIMFVCHYDSTAYGPGAGDDLISVASMLESMRMIKENGKLTNDMYFLFTDGEEDGLVGSRLFIETRSDMKDKILWIVNLEARGNEGSVLMFETSANNSGSIAILAKAVKNISAISGMSDLYSKLPNKTDFTNFLAEGYKGINFAAIDGLENYHKPTDSFDNLNRDTAYMYFTTTTQLADYMSTADLDTLEGREDAVYFPFIKGNLVIIPNQAMIVSSIVIAVSALCWAAWILAKKYCRLKDFLKAVLVMLGAVAGTGLIGWTGSYFYALAFPNAAWTMHVTEMDILFYSLCAVIVSGVAALFYFKTSKGIRTKPYYLSCLCLFALADLACLFFVDGLVYLFTIPLLMMMIYIPLSSLLKKNKRTGIIIKTIFAAISCLITAILFTPVIYMIYLAMIYPIFAADLVIVAFASFSVSILFVDSINNVAEINDIAEV